MTEADLEYLIRTLSEARSRATEIAVSVRARVGVEHRLAELGNSAVSKIETLLQDVRRFAAGGPATATPHDIPAARVVVKPPAFVAALESQNWVHAFVEELMSQSRSPGGVTFETAERLVQQHKQAFLQDLETARRMYRTYPHLFQVEIPARMGAATGV